MYSNILCARKGEFFTLVLYWVAARRDDIPSVRYSLCPTLSSAMLNMHRWLRDPHPKSSEWRRGRKISRLFFFFSAYETNVWHSTEHCSAVGLSVNRRQYARACWRLIWHWLPRNFKRKEELYTSPLLLLFFWGILCRCIPSLICNQLIAELKKKKKTRYRCNYSGIFSLTRVVCVLILRSAL